MIDESHEPGPDGAPMGRRAILKGLTALGVGTATFRRALAAQAEQSGKVSPAMIKQAEWIAGLELSDKEREGAALLRSRQVSSTELTRLYLDRLRRFDPMLKCVVTLTEDVALKQAARAD